METKEQIEKYKSQSVHFLENAFRFIEAKEIEKASEFLWGSMAEAIKAIAISKGFFLKSHRQLWDYAEGLAKELQDESIFNAFRHANSLHSNFYESTLELKDVLRVAEDVRATVGKLLRLLPQGG